MILPLLLLLVPPQLSPAVLDSAPVTIQNGVTVIGTPSDFKDLSQKYPSLPLAKPVRNRSWIALSKGGSLKPGRYWVQDLTPMRTPGEPDRYFGCIVHVTKPQGVKLWLDEPFPKDFRGPAAIVAAPIVHDIKIDGGTTPILLSLCDGAEIRNRKIPDNWDKDGTPRGIAVTNSRNVLAEDNEIGRSVLPKPGPGQAYAFSVCDSVSVTVRRLLATGNRHSGNVLGGSNITFVDCRAQEPRADAFETHGHGATKVLFQNCDWGGSNASFGNKYVLGDQAHVVGGRGIQTVYVYGGVDLWLEGVVCSMVIYHNQAGSPKAINAWDCTFGKISYVGEFTGTLQLAGCLVKSGVG